MKISDLKKMKSKNMNCVIFYRHIPVVGVQYRFKSESSRSQSPVEIYIESGAETRRSISGKSKKTTR